MVIIYYNDGFIKNYYSGTTSQIGWQLANNPNLRGRIHEYITEGEIDNFSPFTHRVVRHKGEVSIVPKIKVNLTQNRNMLNINLSNIHETDDISEIKIPILFDDKKLELEPGEYEIDSNTPMVISVDSPYFLNEPIEWEV